jgi:hypothetical protein
LPCNLEETPVAFRLARLDASEIVDSRSRSTLAAARLDLVVAIGAASACTAGRSPHREFQEEES